MANNQAKDAALMSIFGFSLGVLFAVLYSSLYGSDFGMSCSSYMHGNEHESAKQIKEISEPINFDDLSDEHHKGGDKIAKSLAKKVRVLCWVMTSPTHLRSKGKAVKETWGKRCNKIIFMSTVTDNEFPAIELNTENGGRDTWSKTRAAWKYIYKNHINDADWFLRADDETFVIVENLRLLLSKYNTDDPHYFGRWFKIEGGYNSDGAGYVFSKKTLDSFVKVMQDPEKCSDTSIGEEGNVGKCLAAIGIHPEDTRDDMKRETFHPFSPENHIVPGSIKANHWLHGHNKFPVFSGADCCSDNSITFHYIRPEYMYILEYLIYHLRPYGVQNTSILKKKLDRS